MYGESLYSMYGAVGLIYYIINRNVAVPLGLCCSMLLFVAVNQWSREGRTVPARTALIKRNDAAPHQPFFLWF